ncbi:MAG TPA: M1 family aminopeptidase [Candidatus Kapabacteria bacterium]|nr:M1 family aminopeptidase [Candidatus Kapabacteria bacterium]
MNKLVLCVLLIVSVRSLPAQPSDYWQQHVSYMISGTLIDSIHSFDGKLSVVYTNNSPDTLHEVYFHLYANAFRPKSMMYERGKALRDLGLVQKMDHYKPSDWGGYIVKQVLTGNSDARFEITGTIMKVVLDHPLPPKHEVEISMPFLEQIPLLTRRSGWMNNDGIKYSMSQWYPKVCEYDREGWHHQEYVAREFYGVWGDFDVTMTVPSKFCVGATGQCQNPEEVGWGYDQIAKGVKKGKAYPDSVAKTQQSSMLTWHFKASNVHDFAWVAHEYIHEWDTWNDTVTVHCLYKESEDKDWAEAMKNTFFMLDHHSKKVGWYQYRNFTNTHAGDGGMEYPQLIMDGSASAGLIMHEGGHQWFYGMLGNNETRYAFLDEGFTEFIEMTGMEAYHGRAGDDGVDKRPWLSRMLIPLSDTRRGYYSPYLDLATEGYEEPLTIPHDWFRENVNAGQVYFKTLAGLAQLEYVLGDSIFWAGMKEYFRRWHFKHPTLLDFRRTMQDVSGADLDYYFDEWFASTRTIDYAACGVSSDEQSDGTYKTTVKLRNKDVGVAPVDLTVHYNDGTTGIATIPLSVNQGTSYKKPEAGRIFFPDWDWVSPWYKGSIVTPKKVSWYEIDTSMRLMDLDRRNNSSAMFPNIEWAFLKEYNLYPPLGNSYGIVRPIIGYDEISKLNLGIGLNFGTARLSSGDLKLIFKPNAARYADSGKGLVSVKPVWSDYIDGEIRYERNVPMLGRLTNFTADLRKINDVTGVNLALTHTIRPEYLYLGPTHTIGVDLDFEQRGAFADDNIGYPVYPEHWDPGISRSLGVNYHFTSTDRKTLAFISVRIGSLFVKEKLYDSLQHQYYATSTDGFSQVLLGLSHTFVFANEFDLHLRGSLGRTAGTLVDQYNLQLSGATFSDELRSDLFRTVANISRHFSEQGHFFVEGGAGVRGYADQYYDPNYQYTLNGNDMIGFNADLTVPNPLRSLGWLPASFGLGLFGDAGWAGNFQHGTLSSAQSISDVTKHVLTDAGVTIKVNLLSWLPWQLDGAAEQYGQIPTIDLYFPVYQNHPFDGKNNFAFRYMIGIGSTFKI